VADKDKITQVFTNLISNALKFTDKGTIEISTVDTGPALECRVSDTGVGIPKQALPKVFDKFHEISLPSSGEKGTGLGLAICKSIVELHGGDIRVESTLGKGTAVSITLPKSNEHNGE